ncbi:hypothetical protein B296_00014382 [Ensete ventricosum]|uniref:Uncharacterized protein n=1 Tax=Ensete ventricosum TaxID=4639 RepID=A0A426X8X5_ENSVE|nr:hypothetical protein B296_00014382 [Ensete ventricosum]
MQLDPSASLSLPLCKRRLPLHTGSFPAKERPPLRLVSSPLLAIGLVAGCSPLRAPSNRPPFACATLQVTMPAGGYCPHRRCPLRAGPSHSQPPPYRGPWPRPSRGWPALHGSWPWLATPPPHCLRCEIVARSRRTILHNSFSSHAV